VVLDELLKVGQQGQAHSGAAATDEAIIRRRQPVARTDELIQRR
jgi:hypothetical protein